MVAKIGGILWEVERPLNGDVQEDNIMIVGIDIYNKRISNKK